MFDLGFAGRHGKLGGVLEHHLGLAENGVEKDLVDLPSHVHFVGVKHVGVSPIDQVLLLHL